MRLRLTLIARQLCYLPLNYQGLLSAAIYKKLGQADPVLAQWLHQKGYGQDGKLFKLFCFSPLTGMPYRIHKEAEAIEFPQGKVEWQVAFYVDAILQQFIIGLFKNQHLGLGNERFKPVDFDITQVEVLPEPTWQDTMTYTCMSPVIVSEGELNKEYAQYRSPDDLNYEKLIQNNLHQRLRAILSVPIQTQELPFKIRIMNQYRRKGVNIHEYTERQTRLIGYTYDCKITAPVELQRLIWYSGLGEKGSQGFGWVQLK